MNIIDQTTIDAINKTVTDMVTNLKPFTAYTIFQELQKQGIKASHSVVRDTIHSVARGYVVTGVYKTSKVTSPTGNAVLYHDPNYIAEDFFATTGTQTVP